ncbi:MAG: DUF1972 domain-containing protein [Chitinophagaceae bacterium]|nr:DUF1972 domain-containing protein [Chitinophagaceae bacterium]
MKIGIIGTRGIPNQYGGFEQFTEFIAPALVKRGHDMYVYNSSLHPYKENSWKGVHLIPCSDPENRIGTVGQFIYDLNCILDARKRNFDVILQLGYTSSSIWSFLFPKRTVVVTNMDGLEWKRSKYSKPVQQFLKKAEKWAAFYSDKLIADSKGIQDYLLEKYRKHSDFIAYGASLFNDPNESVPGKYGVDPYSYNLLIARMEPENNIETILKGFRQSSVREVLLLVGNHSNSFGTQLKQQYQNERIRFLGPVYDLDQLNDLRHFSHFYFHGHSVGGTNPSLLEAMASNALIIANDNVFNRAVLEEDAFYFSTPDDITKILNTDVQKDSYKSFIERNREKIRDLYSWEYITDLLEKSLKDATIHH